MFLGKLRSRWDGPFIVTKVFPHGTVKIQNPTNRHFFKVNGQRLKYFVKNLVDGQIIELQWAGRHLAEDDKLSLIGGSLIFFESFWSFGLTCGSLGVHMCVHFSYKITSQHSLSLVLHVWCCWSTLFAFIFIEIMRTMFDLGLGVWVEIIFLK